MTKHGDTVGLITIDRGYGDDDDGAVLSAQMTKERQWDHETKGELTDGTS